MVKLNQVCSDNARRIAASLAAQRSTGFANISACHKMAHLGILIVADRFAPALAAKA